MHAKTNKKVSEQELKFYNKDFAFVASFAYENAKGRKRDACTCKEKTEHEHQGKQIVYNLCVCVYYII